MYASPEIEQQLMAAFAEGQHAATSRLYAQHYPTVAAWMNSYGGGEDDAADIFQEAMVVFYNKARDPDFRLTCKAGTYLFAICKHLWYKRAAALRKGPASLSQHEEDHGATPDVANDIGHHEEREAQFALLATSLSKIGEPCKSLLQAYYMRDLSMQQIAAEFGYTNADNAKTQKYKCLNRLKKLFNAAGSQH